MKIAYMLHWNISQESGVLKKVHAQIKNWAANGHEVKLFVLTPEAEVWEAIEGWSIEKVIQGSIQNRFGDIGKLVNRCIEWSPDIVYLRYSTYYPALVKLAKKLPTILEINSIDTTEYKEQLPRYQYAYHRLFRARLLNKVMGLVCLSREIADFFEPFKKPYTVISNGIDLAAFRVENTNTCKQPRLVFMGSPNCPWHGFEKIITLAKRYPKWRFDIIGIDQNYTKTTFENINFHGYCCEATYMTVMKRADVAIGSLSMYLNKMSEASPLKSREYLACGLPVITGYRDTDFPRNTPFLLQLPNTPDNVEKHLQQIERFVKIWQGKRVMPSDVKAIDMKDKEKIRLMFFEELRAAKIVEQACP